MKKMYLFLCLLFTASLSFADDRVFDIAFSGITCGAPIAIAQLRLHQTGWYVCQCAFRRQSGS